MRTVIGTVATLVLGFALAFAQNTDQPSNDPNRASADQSAARTTNDVPRDHDNNWGWIGLLGLAGLGGLAGRAGRNEVRDRDTTKFRRAA